MINRSAILLLNAHHVGLITQNGVTELACRIKKTDSRFFHWYKNTCIVANEFCNTDPDILPPGGVGAACFQLSIGSLSFAGHNAYHSSPRPLSNLGSRHSPLQRIQLMQTTVCDDPEGHKVRLAMPPKMAGARGCRSFDRIYNMSSWIYIVRMILPQVHLRKPCYDFSFL